MKYEDILSHVSEGFAHGRASPERGSNCICYEVVLCHICGSYGRISDSCPAAEEMSSYYGCPWS